MAINGTKILVYNRTAICIVQMTADYTPKRSNQSFKLLIRAPKNTKEVAYFDTFQ